MQDLGAELERRGPVIYRLQKEVRRGADGATAAEGSAAPGAAEGAGAAVPVPPPTAAEL